MDPAKVRRGSQLTHAKLDENDVRLILELVEYREQARKQSQKLREEVLSLSNKALGEKFGVHYETISKVVRRIDWSHVS